MEQCRKFELYDKVEDDLRELIFSDMTQEQSLKSLHKRQDRADELREVVTEKLTCLTTAVNESDIQLKTHMEWEEKMSNLEHENREANNSFLKWLAGLFFVGLLAFTSYTMVVIHNTEKLSLNNATQINNIDNSLSEIKEMIKTKKD